MIKELIREYKTRNFTVKIEAVNFCEGSHWFNELYEASDYHIAGTTIQVPAHLQSRHAPSYYIGQYTPSELASDFAKQGRENPSAEAYKSLQDELAHYIEANDCALLCSVSANGVSLSSVGSCVFDYSYDYCGDFEDYAKTMLKEYPDFIAEAIEEARNTINNLPTLKTNKA